MLHPKRSLILKLHSELNKPTDLRQLPALSDRLVSHHREGSQLQTPSFNVSLQSEDDYSVLGIGVEEFTAYVSVALKA